MKGQSPRQLGVVTEALTQTSKGSETEALVTWKNPTRRPGRRESREVEERRGGAREMDLAKEKRE